MEMVTKSRHTAGRQFTGEILHERMMHACPGPVSQDQEPSAIVRAEQERLNLTH